MSESPAKAPEAAVTKKLRKGTRSCFECNQLFRSPDGLSQMDS